MTLMAPLRHPAALAALLTLGLMPAAPATAQENPLLSRPSTASGRFSPAPDRLTPLEAEKARAYQDRLGADLRERERLDAQGRLDPIERRETLDLAVEARRIGRVLQAPEALPALSPSDAELNDTLRRDPLPGTGYPTPRLGRGGATLQPGISQPPPRKPPVPPG